MSKEYTEREAVIKAIENDCLELVYYTKEDVIQCVKAIPAADVIPVVHGQWIGIDSSFWKPTHSSDIPVFRKTYRCSECGRRTAIAENYCPNCGAYMMGENNGKCE
nr:MAG TPA: hydrogenase/urease nickel incorporation protein [Bacteriophage sp.]